MSYMGDLAREQRHKAEGGKRITARVSGEAHDMLVSLAAHYRMTCGEVLERLIRGDRLSSWSDTELHAIRRQLADSSDSIRSS